MKIILRKETLKLKNLERAQTYASQLLKFKSFCPLIWSELLDSVLLFIKVSQLKGF